jgi:hypothetical protein
MSDTQIELMKAELEALKKQFEEIKASKTVKKAVIRHGHPPKAYAGLSGHYFEFQKADDHETYQDVKAQLDNCLSDPKFKEDLTKNNLGDAILNYYQKTGNMIFWTPNQETLMFGHVRSGVKEYSPSQLFNIPQSKGLIQLGKHNEEGKIQVELTVNFQQFMEDKMNEKRRRKCELTIATLNQKQAQSKKK